MSMQDWIDGVNAGMQRERAKTQMTLGKLIETLEAMPADARVVYLGRPHSYRGYYCDLAFELDCRDTRSVDDLLTDCRSAMGKVFQGYKGGDYVMGAQTPVWVADYGCCGAKLMTLCEGGGFGVGEDES